MKKPFMGYSTPEKKICLTGEYNPRSKGKGKIARRGGQDQRDEGRGSRGM
ncbi:MAG: hypothetical protein HS132_11195 [Planctomycetia bacterium]|nr:hypothetical protein [Planctomycetia bacterium]